MNGGTHTKTYKNNILAFDFCFYSCFFFVELCQLVMYYSGSFYVVLLLQLNNINLFDYYRDIKEFWST